MQKKISQIFQKASSKTKENAQKKTPEKTVAVNNNKTESQEEFISFEQFQNNLGSWKSFLKDYVESPKFKSIYEKVKQKYSQNKCYPPQEKLFNAFQLADIDRLKVVIVGQDPYHQPGQAMGLCFSVPKNIKTPPSLKNIYKCITNDPAFKNFIVPNHGDLTQWAEQGVFLINALLSVDDSKPMSHKSCGWEDFTDSVIKYIDSKKQGVVFMLWGKPAQKKEALIKSKNNLILKTTHPSPFSARYGFLDSKHFSIANEFLKQNNKKEINWQIDN